MTSDDKWYKAVMIWC